MSLTPPFSRFGLVPDAQVMYDPAAEKDACGLAMVATLRGTAGHDIITAALDALLKRRDLLLREHGRAAAD